MANILIKENLCTKCNVCSQVCIMSIIDPATEEKFPSIPNEKQAYCFKCGHCEAFCKTKALRLDFNLSDSQIEEFDKTNISKDSLSFYIKKRRSIRHYQNKPVEKELINQLMDTVRYAATGGNSQNVKYLLIYNTEEVKKISALTVDWMRSILNTPHPLAPYVSNVVQLWDSGIDFISHNAPHILIAHIPYSEFINDPTDGIIALTHFDILAPTYGLGSCWGGFIKMAMSSYKPLQEAISLPENRVAVYPMLFGYPIYTPMNIPERNAVEIEWR